MRFNDRPQRVNGKFYAIYWDDEGRYRHSLRTDDPAVARTTICEFIRHFNFAQSSKIGLTGRKVFDLYIEDRTVEGKLAVPRMRDAWSDWVGFSMLCHDQTGHRNQRFQFRLNARAETLGNSRAIGAIPSIWRHVLVGKLFDRLLVLHQMSEPHAA